MSSFIDLVGAKIAGGKHLCVGIDPVPEKHPAGISVAPYMMRIVEATIDIAACYKPNAGFFEPRGFNGLWEYMALVAHIRHLDPAMPIIGDLKRGDIGWTNEGYATAAYQVLEVDALTISPYLGLGDAAEVFLKHPGKTAIVLCRTSNKGAREFQDLVVDTTDDPVNGRNHVPLYQVVARNVARDWSQVGSVGLVAGATYPDELRQIREIAPETFLLIPAVGRQQGDLVNSVTYAYNPQAPADFVINVSSGVMYADPSDPKTFAAEARSAAENYDRQIREAIASLATE